LGAISGGKKIRVSFRSGILDCRVNQVWVKVEGVGNISADWGGWGKFKEVFGMYPGEKESHCRGL